MQILLEYKYDSACIGWHNQLVAAQHRERCHTALWNVAMSDKVTKRRDNNDLKNEDLKPCRLRVGGGDDDKFGSMKGMHAPERIRGVSEERWDGIL